MKGVIYARYSSDNQREESIEGQLRECMAFADKNDIQIVETYIDRALSAKTDNRPAFQRMIRDSIKEQFEVIIVWKLDRFARNRYDSAHYKAILKRNNIYVISATEKIKRPTLTKEQVVLWLKHFRELDPKDQKHRKRLVDSFVNAVILYDDKIEFYFNFKNGATILKKDDLEKGSDLFALTPPETPH